MSDPVTLALVVDEVDDSGDRQTISFVLPDVPANAAFSDGSLVLTTTDPTLFGHFKPQQALVLTVAEAPTSAVVEPIAPVSVSDAPVNDAGTTDPAASPANPVS